MAKIYISATYGDLKECRRAVYDILRKVRHDVIAMEDYVATDQRPLNKCLDDVAACDVYVGLLAWRYGYIPVGDNPEKLSITQLEYRKAGEVTIPRLMFLLHKDAAWPDDQKDALTGENCGGTKIAEFRGEIEEAALVGYFKKPDDLAALVLAAVYQELTKRPPPPRTSRVAQIKAEALNREFAHLVSLYEAVGKRIATTLSPTDEVKLKKERAELEVEMERVESALTEVR
jgi:hypothetical protein